MSEVFTGVPVEAKSNSTAAFDESVDEVVAESVAELTAETETIETSVATAESATVGADEPAVGVEVPTVVESVSEIAEVSVPVETERSVVLDAEEAEPSDLVPAVSPPATDALNTNVVEVPAKAVCNMTSSDLGTANVRFRRRSSPTISNSKPLQRPILSYCHQRKPPPNTQGK